LTRKRPGLLPGLFDVFIPEPYKDACRAFVLASALAVNILMPVAY
jgi:hypothetical protein